MHPANTLISLHIHTHCTSAQSDKSPQCPPEEILDVWLSAGRAHRKGRSDCADGQADWCLLGRYNFSCLPTRLDLVTMATDESAF